MLSARSGSWLGALRRARLQCIGWQAPPEGVFVDCKRHRLVLQRTAVQLLAPWGHAAGSDMALDLFAEARPMAHDVLSEVAGAAIAGDLLGEVFGDFLHWQMKAAHAIP